MSSYKQSNRNWRDSTENKPKCTNGDSSSNWRSDSLNSRVQANSANSSELTGWTTIGQCKTTDSHEVKSSYVRPVDNRSKSHAYNVKTAIKIWASSKKSCSELIDEYFSKIKSWETEKFINDNRLTMIKELSRNLRNDVLAELLRTNSKFGSSLPLKGYTPLQYVGYPDKNVAKTATLEDLISTASVLIDSYGFKTFVNCNDDIGYKETIYGSLQTRHNPLSEDLREKFYEYLTQTAPSSWFFPNFNGNLNKLTSLNVDAFHNKLVMVLCRFPKQVAKIVFFKLMGRAPRVERLKQVELVIHSLLSDINEVDYEMNKYLGTVDLKLQKSDFVAEFLMNGHEWILEDSSCFEAGTEEHDDRVALNTNIYFSALGSIYVRGFGKSEIMKKMTKIVEQEIRPKWTVRAIAMFLIHANINSNSTDVHESELFLNFLKKCYQPGTVRNKIDVENGLELNAKEIQELIVDTTKSEIKIKEENDETMRFWDKIMDDAGDEIADFD